MLGTPVKQVVGYNPNNLLDRDNQQPRLIISKVQRLVSPNYLGIALK